ncbi:MAG: DUF4442 domain-containing protein [Moraxellaceae bacterium]|nr:MAG: DUF4442 domain-containing protein [Moraxellaceae bacterium]
MTSSIFDQYKKLNKIPLGNLIFNFAIGIKAPFFGKIKPDVVALGSGICRVKMKDRWGVRNHIGTVNAGAMCTLAEITGGLALDATIPSDLRWIPKGMTVSYLVKGVGLLEAECSFDKNIIETGDVILPVVIRNMDDTVVFKADITFYISSKQK